MYKLLINGFPNISSAKIKLFELHIGNYMLSKTKELQYTRTTFGLCILLQSMANTHNNSVQAQSSQIVIINSLNMTIEIHSTDFCFSGFKPPSSRSCDHEYYNSLEDLAK